MRGDTGEAGEVLPGRTCDKDVNGIGGQVSRSDSRLPSMPRILALLLSFAVLGSVWLGAAEVTAGPKVEVKGDLATLTWTTDVSCNTRAAAGSSPEALLMTEEGVPGVQHTVTFDGLKAGRTYYYAVGSGKKWLQRGSFTTTGGVAPANPEPPKAAVPTGSSVPEAKKPSLFSQIVDRLKGETAPTQPTTAKPTPKPAPAAAGNKAPPTHVTWNSMASLQDHYDRHGADFDATSPEDYAAQAWYFLQRAKAEKLPMKLDAADGTVRVWDPKTRAFAAFTERGRTRTFFRPNNPSYWSRQPGKPIAASDLPF
jgi:hypothetical protein